MKYSVLILSLAALTITAPGFAQTAGPSTADPVPHVAAGLPASKTVEPAKAVTADERRWREQEKRINRVMTICTGC